jgi:hypothetical protein
MFMEVVGWDGDSRKAFKRERPSFFLLEPQMTCPKVQQLSCAIETKATH